MLELFWEPEWKPRSRKNGSQKSLRNSSKELLIFDQFWGPIGVQNGFRKAQIRGPKSDLRSSRVPGALRGLMLDGFLIISGAMFRLFSEGFWTSQDDMLLILLMSLKRLLRHLVRYLERLVRCLPYACV